MQQRLSKSCHSLPFQQLCAPSALHGMPCMVVLHACCACLHHVCPQHACWHHACLHMCADLCMHAAQALLCQLVALLSRAAHAAATSLSSLETADAAAATEHLTALIGTLLCVADFGPTSADEQLLPGLAAQAAAALRLLADAATSQLDNSAVPAAEGAQPAAYVHEGAPPAADGAAVRATCARQARAAGAAAAGGHAISEAPEGAQRGLERWLPQSESGQGRESLVHPQQWALGSSAVNSRGHHSADVAGLAGQHPAGLSQLHSSFRSKSLSSSRRVTFNPSDLPDDDEEDCYEREEDELAQQAAGVQALLLGGPHGRGAGSDSGGAASDYVPVAGFGRGAVPAGEGHNGDGGAGALTLQDRRDSDRMSPARSGCGIRRSGSSRKSAAELRRTVSRQGGSAADEVPLSPSGKEMWPGAALEVPADLVLPASAVGGSSVNKRKEWEEEHQEEEEVGEDHASTPPVHDWQHDESEGVGGGASGTRRCTPLQLAWLAQCGTLAAVAVLRAAAAAGAAMQAGAAAAAAAAAATWEHGNSASSGWALQLQMMRAVVPAPGSPVGRGRAGEVNILSAPGLGTAATAAALGSGAVTTASPEGQGSPSTPTAARPGATSGTATARGSSSGGSGFSPRASRGGGRYCRKPGGPIFDCLGGAWPAQHGAFGGAAGGSAAQVLSLEGYEVMRDGVAGQPHLLDAAVQLLEGLAALGQDDRCAAWTKVWVGCYALNTCRRTWEQFSWNHDFVCCRGGEQVARSLVQR